MAKARRNIRKRDARVLLSEVLPYEIPPSFSNRGLYDFLNATQLSVSQGVAEARMVGAGTELLLRVIMGWKDGPKLAKGQGTSGKQRFLGNPHPFTVPFQFTIRHNRNDYRTLTVPHPAAQLEISAFYARYADLILYHTSRSNFSLRRPARVARYSVVRDRVFESKRGGLDPVEEDHREYDWIRSYFTYEKYSSIFKFYDSREYRERERRYGYLVRADVAKCFDSIYTHSVAWAVHGHDLVKSNLNRLEGTFGDDFDRLMQRLNHRETSGITIGSELSRIFAEIVLQAVDVDVERELDSHGLRFGVDYDVLRYVDDYFIFLADEHNKSRVLDTLARHLRRYKLHLNAAKQEGEYTPWLSPLTVAKQRVAKLVRKSVKRGRGSAGKDALARPRADVERLSIGYKAVLIDTGVGHHELANYTLAQVEWAVERLIRFSQSEVERAAGMSPTERVEHVGAVVDALLGVMEFAFFAYSGAPRMSPTVKIARIMSSIVRFGREGFVLSHDRERIEAAAGSEVVAQMRRLAGSDPDAVTATLLDCVSFLGSEHVLDEVTMIQLLGFREAGTRLEPPGSMNAFLLFSILMHTQGAQSYSSIVESSLRWATGLLEREPNDAERAIVSLNLLSCPFVDDELKQRVAGAYGVSSSSVSVSRFGSDGPLGNVSWTGFDLYDALQRKRLYEVY
ncbi:antiviral reverse transcriptase Drt3b [Cellulosimicrobium marinum]|uniref:antiviral reverse transcriptase Drt3b n=1 Tax=Cellulosimicrobium marinum TaxID=1638992 RepID=UPI001E61FCB1|nr:antiviral reverse transcriptase Drt3b [Cellulosimicrobium marinum]MCB7137446.1 RNA-directed DNA polymerase [Cellulosimicrobium marinum]